MNDFPEDKPPLKDHLKKNPLKAIRANCLDCSGNQAAEVRRCHLTDCPLWPFRMGKNPYHKRKITDQQKDAATKNLIKNKNKR